MKAITAIILILALSLALASYATLPTESARDGVIACRPWSRISWNGYLLENNVWGDPKSSQCVFASNDSVGWFWIKGPSSKPVYPEIIYGKKPWIKHSTTDRLPAVIRSLRSVVVRLDYETMATGRYNALIDVWITYSGVSDHNTIAHEIGIFLEGGEAWKCRLVEIGGYCWCYSRSEGRWRFHKFTLVNGTKPREIDVMDFIRFLRHEISPSLYLASVEFGNEVWSGRGVTVVKYFNVTVVDP